MSRSVFWRVVLKDLYLSRWICVLSISMGIVAIVLTRLGPAGFYPATVLAMTAVFMQGAFLCMNSVVAERQKRSLLFTLALPLSTRQYTAAKSLAVIAAYLAPWAFLGIAAALLLTIASPHSGLIPIGVIWWLFLLDLFCLMLAVALASKSEGWAPAMIVVTSLSVSFFVYFTQNIPSISATMLGPIAVWSAAAIRIFAAELVLPAVILASTFLLLACRKDFV